jgi:hypothetical protein
MKQVLDRKKLQNLKAVLGDDKCDAALKRFQDELGTCLSAIEARTPESAESAHRLAGVAGLLGFDDLEEHSRRFLEVVHREAGQVASSTDALIEAAHRAEAELAAKV